MIAIMYLTKGAVSWKFGHCCFLRNFFDALCDIILEKNIFPKQGLNNSFKPVIPSVFTTVASRLKPEKKENEI